MTKREIILVGIIVVVVLGLLGAWLWQPAPKPVAQVQPPPISTHQAPTTSTFTPPPPLPDPGGPLSIKTMSREEATKLYVQRVNADHNYDWKVPLNFYGKVVDENNQPVVDAKVHFDWNTIDAPGGTAFKEAFSDGNGLFSLTGQRGKDLGVTVQKEGYYSVDRGGAEVSFEYANPWSPDWYESDPNNPVIFHLRKKGEGAKLFSKSLNVPLHGKQAQASVNLMQGSIKSDGVLTVTSDTSNWLPGNQPYPWTFGLSMAEGGLIETKDQFPFEAPTSGYVSSITINDDNLERGVWQGGVKKTYYFYLPSTNTYGRLTVNKVASLPSVLLNYSYNLTPGNRVLEPASR